MKTVLLIDYDPYSIERVRRLLSSAGYQTAIARDGANGIRAFERLQPDLTLVEGLLPRKNGFAVCRELKSRYVGKSHPVVVITGPGAGLKRELRMTGCDASLEKPYSDDALLTTVRSLVENGNAPTPISSEIPTAVVTNDISAKLGNVDRPARLAPPPKPEIPVAFLEEDIMPTLDAILPGKLQDVPPAKTGDTRVDRRPGAVVVKNKSRSRPTRKKKRKVARKKRCKNPSRSAVAEKSEASSRAGKTRRGARRSTSAGRRDDS